MPFRAINTYEEELLAQEERHSLELRLESAMKLFQHCLESQATRSSSTPDSYAKLFELIPQSESGDSDVPPAARRLRAMALKNWAVWLLSDPQRLPEIVQLVTEALELTEGRDASTLELLARVCWGSGWLRLARLSVESVATSVALGEGALSPLQKQASSNRARLMGPHDRNILDALTTIVSRIESQPWKEPSLLALPAPFPVKAEDSGVDQKLQVVIIRPTWATIAEAMASASAESVKTGRTKVWLRSPHELTSSSESDTSLETGMEVDGSTENPTSEKEVPLPSTDETSPQKEPPVLPETQQNGEEKQSQQHVKDPMIDSEVSSNILSDSESRKRPLRDTTAERGTKRSKDDDNMSLPQEFTVIEDIFCDHIRGYLATVDENFNTTFPSPSGTYEAWFMRFSEWDDRETREFTPYEPSKAPHPDHDAVLRMLENASLPSPTSPDLEDGKGVTEFLAQADGKHIALVEIELALCLLRRGTNGANSACMAAIERAEPSLWALNRQEPVVAQRMFELFADMMMSTTEADEVLVARCNRWRTASAESARNHSTLQLRHAWVAALVDQRTVPPEEGAARFERLLSELPPDTDDPNFSVTFGLRCVPPLSRDQIMTQVTKWKAAAVFERAFASSDPTLLEQILLGDPSPEIRRFLAGSSTEFKLQLWYMLYQSYAALYGPNNGAKVRSALLRIASLAAHTSPLRHLAVLEHISENLLEYLGAISDSQNDGDISVAEAREALPVVVQTALEPLEHFVLFEEATLSNMARKSDHITWPEVAERLRSMTARWWAVFYAYMRTAYRDVSSANATDALADLISIVHERLGRAALCNSGSGLITKLHLAELVRFRLVPAEVDLAQCLYCRFGLNMVTGTGGVHVVTHAPAAIDLDSADTSANKDLVAELSSVAPLVADVVLSKRSPGVALLRTDLRGVLDAIYASVGAPSFEPIEAFLAQPVTTSLLLKAWTGRLVPPPPWLQDSKGLGDFYYVVGVAQLGQCRVRRRTIDESDAQQALHPFFADLSAHPMRTESWLGVAQALELQYELFTEESGRSDGGKAAQAALEQAADACRQSLIASSVALSLLLNANEGPKDEALTLFGRMLALAALPPLLGLPFTTKPSQRYVLPMSSAPSGGSGQPQRPQTLRLQRPIPNSGLVLKLAVRALRKTQPLLAAHAAQWLGQTSVALKLSSRAFPDTDAGSYMLELLITTVEEVPGARKWISQMCKALKLKSQNLLDENTPIDDLLDLSLQSLLSKTKWLHRPRYLLARLWHHRGDAQRAIRELGELFSLKSGEPLRMWRTDSEYPGLRGVYMLEYWIYYADLLLETRDDVGLGRLAHRFRRYTAEIPGHLRGWEHTIGCAVDLGRSLLGIEAKYAEKHLSLLPADFRDQMAPVEPQTSPGNSSNPSECWGAMSVWVPALAWALELRRLNNGYGSTSGVDDLVVALFLRMWFEGVIPKMPVAIAGVSIATSSSSTSTVTASVPPPSTSQTVASTGGANEPQGDAADNGPGANSEPKSRKRVTRKEVLQAAQQLMRPVLPKLNKLDDLGIPDALRKREAQSILAPQARRQVAPAPDMQVSSAPQPEAAQSKISRPDSLQPDNLQSSAASQIPSSYDPVPKDANTAQVGIQPQGPYVSGTSTPVPVPPSSYPVLQEYPIQSQGLSQTYPQSYQQAYPQAYPQVHTRPHPQAQIQPQLQGQPQAEPQAEPQVQPLAHMPAHTLFPPPVQVPMYTIPQYTPAESSIRDPPHPTMQPDSRPQNQDQN